jgi:hypothetical protein
VRAGKWPADYVNGPQDPQSDPGKFMRDASTAFAAPNFPIVSRFVLDGRQSSSTVCFFK